MFKATLLIVAALIPPIIPLPTSLVRDDLHNPASLNQTLLTTSGEFNNLTDIHHLVTENCGHSFFYINEAATQARRLTQAALFDVRRNGVNSDFGFQAMFKNKAALPTVTAILEHIYLLKGIAGLRPRPDMSLPPRLSCVTKDSARVYRYLNLGYDPWQKCLAGGPGSRPVRAFYAEGTAYIFLCPAFLIQSPMSTRKHCPSVTDNKFSGDATVFYQKYQTYILLYQLIRFYLGHNALADDTNPKEQLDWNDCVGLDTLSSVLNPTNLQVYIALVSQQCVRWPDPFEPPFTGPHSLYSNSTSNQLSTLVNTF